MAKSAARAIARHGLDPTLAALFADSAGPLKPASKQRHSEALEEQLKSRRGNSSEAKSGHGRDEDDEGEGEGEEEEGDDDDDDNDESENDSVGDVLLKDDADGLDMADAHPTGNDTEALSEAVESEESAGLIESLLGQGTLKTKQPRKRRRAGDNDDLEAKHLQRLSADTLGPDSKRRKVLDATNDAKSELSLVDDEASEDDVPVHEALAKDKATTELEKAARTVFLSNVSSDVITDRGAKKTLVAHLSSILDKSASPAQSIESIRFRSTAFSTAAIPKRAAFIKKSIMEATTKSTNAYVVYSNALSARLATSQLNGTVILDRHLRVDSVAHPAAVDHRRCVFVGNLGFVDDESVLNVKVDDEGKPTTEKRKRTKTPMDVDEGLWRVFSKGAGKVENVRVVRDPTTRVGKGFAYVQFYDANAVEAAILLSGKKFPPLLPRELRVSRCKAPHKTARAMEAKTTKAMPKHPSANGYVPKPNAHAQTLAGRAGKLLGRAGAVQFRGKAKKARQGRRPEASGEAVAGEKTFKAPEEFIFEGRRASTADGKPKDLKLGKNKSPKSSQGKAAKNGRGAQRAAKWRAQGSAK